MTQGPLGVRKLLIIGCSGYIGSHLLDAILDTPDLQVTGIDPEDAKIRRHLGKPNFRFIKKHMQDADVMADLQREIEAADAVINLAAICNPAEYNTRPLDVIRSNFIEGYPLIDMCAAAGKWLLHFSTSETYGRTLSSYVGDTDYEREDLYLLEEDETPLIMGPVKNQRWSYASAKQLMERYIFAHHTDSGLPFTIIRPLNFFGPRMDYIPGRDGEGVPRVLACFMTNLFDRTPMKLVDGGSARRTIVSIQDAIRAIVLMLKKPEQAKGHIFNIGNPANEVTMAELADMMRKTYARISGDESYLSHPMESVSSQVFYGPGYEDCDRRMPNIDKARRQLGWEPEMSLEDTLLITMRYFHEHYNPKLVETA